MQIVFQSQKLKKTKKINKKKFSDQQSGLIFDESDWASIHNNPNPDYLWTSGDKEHLIFPKIEEHVGLWVLNGIIQTQFALKCLYNIRTLLRDVWITTLETNTWNKTYIN